jgi:hypothetical protein
MTLAHAASKCGPLVPKCRVCAEFPQAVEWTTPRLSDFSGGPGTDPYLPLALLDRCLRQALVKDIPERPANRVHLQKYRIPQS